MQLLLTIAPNCDKLIRKPLKIKYKMREVI